MSLHRSLALRFYTTSLEQKNKQFVGSESPLAAQQAPSDLKPSKLVRLFWGGWAM